MSIGHFGSKEYVEKQLNKISPTIQEIETSVVQIIDNEKLMLQNRVNELESQLLLKEKEIIEVPVEKIVEVIKQIPVEVIKEVRVVREKFVEVPVEKIIRVVEEKIVEKFIDKPVEIIKEISFVPLWVYGVLSLETLTIISLVIKLIGVK